MLYLQKNVPDLKVLVNELGYGPVEVHYGVHNPAIPDLILSFEKGEEISTCPSVLDGLSQKSAIIRTEKGIIHIDFFNHTYSMPGKDFNAIDPRQIETMQRFGFDFLDFKYA